MDGVDRKWGWKMLHPPKTHARTHTHTVNLRVFCSKKLGLIIRRKSTFVFWSCHRNLQTNCVQLRNVKWWCRLSKYWSWAIVQMILAESNLLMEKLFIRKLFNLSTLHEIEWIAYITINCCFYPDDLIFGAHFSSHLYY